MNTRFVLDFSKRGIVNSQQRSDYNNQLIVLIKTKLNLGLVTTIGSCDVDINFSEIYVKNIYKYLKHALKDFYKQSFLEYRICDTLQHEALHLALYEVGENTEKNVEFVSEKMRGLFA